MRTAGARGEGHFAQLILTLGISLILQNGGLIVFGSTLGLDPHAAVEFGAGNWSRCSTTPACSSTRRAARRRGLAGDDPALTLLITRSRLGKSLRAAADNPDAATYMGIDVDRAHRIAFALGSGVTAIAGGLMATYYPFQPFVGLDYVIIMYAGVVLGGMGSILGAFWGGMTIGLVQQSPR